MKQFWTLSVLICCFLSYACNPKTTSFQGLPVIDLTKEYPEKDFSADDNDIEYVLLETTPEVSVDQYFFVKHVSDNRIVVTNYFKGDIFIFDRDGKIVSYFNHQGNSGIDYRSLTQIFLDESKNEILVVDAISKRFLVYSTNGKFLREFRPPANSDFSEMYNFDDQTLLAYYRPNPTLDADDIDQKIPYVFLSKEDGSIVSRVDISLPKRIPEHIHRFPSGEGQLRMGSNNMLQCAQEYVIADMSSDTVYLLTQDKKLTPLFVRTPSVFATGTPIYLSADCKTDRYLFFRTSAYDFSKLVERVRQGKPYRDLITTRNLAYDLHTGDIFTVARSPRFTSSLGNAPANTNIYWYSAGRLIELHEEGKIDRKKLTQIAQAILKEKDEVNPVIEITRLK